jgi:ribosome-associated protein
MVADINKIPDEELLYTFIRSSGPGGQNVNKVATAVQLRFDVLNTTLLDEQLKKRLAKLAGKRMTGEGVLVIEAKRYRSQDKNRQDALERLEHLLEKAALAPAKRHPTRPNLAAKAERLEKKKQQAEKKRNRSLDRKAWE